MKFAKELDEELVPEWRQKYFNYKQGKKKITAIVRAQRNASVRNLKLTKSNTTVAKDSPTRTPFLEHLRHQASSNVTQYGSIHRAPASPELARTTSLTLGEPALAPNEHIPLDDWKETHQKEKDFLKFLDAELKKISSFYDTKEIEVTDRLAEIKLQLHHLQDAHDHQSVNGDSIMQIPAASRDYVRANPVGSEASYRSARRKLKLAIEDFYRGIELLKSYCELNSKAFRKINKKFDKALNVRPPLYYYNNQVKSASFMTSDLPDKQMQEVEDLYAKYFEKGSHKIAVTKLRRKRRNLDASPDSSFRNGILLTIGMISCINGLIGAYRNLFNSDDAVLVTNTSYLLQLYGGYFLLDLLMILFCLACKLFKKFRINYQLVFEFDPRSQLDYTELAELPLLFFAIMGVVMWCNFSDFGPRTLEYIYWPLILIGLTLIIIIFPAPILYYKTRLWFIRSMTRLAFLPGLVTVEFRDFFLGDMFCSETYAMGNIEVFFCLYAHMWQNQARCNSSNSRLLGFFQSLPAIWRFMQCMRRAKNSKGEYRVLNLLNGLKYTFAILAQVTLSVYRISPSPGTQALFITISAIGSLFNIVWDLLMDWSLFSSRKTWLRPVMGFQRYTWMYYAAMIIDPILRFNWIPYAVLKHYFQHSAITSFAIALSEVLRRAMWLVFRVENEHCSNVRAFKAQVYRTLPYHIAHEATEEEAAAAAQPQAVPSTQNAPTPSSAFGTPSLRRMGTFVATTHAQDFVRRRTTYSNEEPHSSDEDDDADDDDDIDTVSPTVSPPTRTRTRTGGNN